MDWSSLLAGGPFAGLLSSGATGAPGAATTGAADASAAPPGAPMNILPPAAQQGAPQPGILNGGGNQQAMAQAMKFLQPQQTQTPAMPQIQMARPVGSAAGFDPSRILAAIRGQQLPA